jgi:hypothetical protein
MTPEGQRQSPLYFPLATFLALASRLTFQPRLLDRREISVRVIVGGQPSHGTGRDLWVLLGAVERAGHSSRASESGRGLHALQDASRESGVSGYPPGFGVRAALCRFSEDRHLQSQPTAYPTLKDWAIVVSSLRDDSAGTLSPMLKRVETLGYWIPLREISKLIREARGRLVA